MQKRIFRSKVLDVIHLRGRLARDAVDSITMTAAADSIHFEHKA